MRLRGFCLKGAKTARQTYLRACIGTGEPMLGQGCRRLAACLHRWPRQRNKQACRQVCSQTKTARQTDRQVDRQANRQADRQTDRQGSETGPKPRTGKDRKTQGPETTGRRTGRGPEAKARKGPESLSGPGPGRPEQDRKRQNSRTGRGPEQLYLVLIDPVLAHAGAQRRNRFEPSRFRRNLV